MAVPAWQYDAYERLRTEILKVAVDDYKAALRKSKRLGEECGAEKALEAFFLGEWGQQLSGGHGECIIERCRKDFRYVKSPKSRPKLTEEQQRALTEDYLSGITAIELAEKYGVGVESAYRCVRRWV